MSALTGCGFVPGKKLSVIQSVVQCIVHCFGEAGYHRRWRGECFKSVALICSLVLNESMMHSRTLFSGISRKAGALWKEGTERETSVY